MSFPIKRLTPTEREAVDRMNVVRARSGLGAIVVHVIDCAKCGWFFESTSREKKCRACIAKEHPP